MAVQLLEAASPSASSGTLRELLEERTALLRKARGAIDTLHASLDERAREREYERAEVCAHSPPRVHTRVARPSTHEAQQEARACSRPTMLPGLSVSRQIRCAEAFGGIVAVRVMAKCTVCGASECSAMGSR